MKKINILFSLVFLLPLLSFGQIASYEVSDNKLTHFLFPTKIEFFKTSVEPDYILIENESENLFVQLMTLDVPESNVIVKTIDGAFYNFIIKPKAEVNELFHQIGKRGESEYKTDSFLGESNPESMAREILSENGFIKSRNTVSKGNMYLYIKGAYVSKNYVFIRVMYENKSNINYIIDKTNFYISEKLSSKERSTDIQGLPILYIFNKTSTILGKTKNEIIYVFEKFTIDEEKNLIIETIERNGDRVLNFPISEETLINAKSIL